MLKIVEGIQENVLFTARFFREDHSLTGTSEDCDLENQRWWGVQWRGQSRTLRIYMSEGYTQPHMSASPLFGREPKTG